MSQTVTRRLEEGGDCRDSVDRYQNLPPQPLQGRPDYSDGSWPLYSMYSKIAEGEDDKMVERCQKDKDGSLIFIGLFSAVVAALLTISTPDLKPNSQDTSAFYLENMYQLQVSGNPNASHPSALAKPPAFSPPRHAIWVNSLWFLSLIVSLWGATVATLFRHWAAQYMTFTHPPGFPPHKRARIRTIFAKGKLGPYYILGSGEELIYLHLSLFLFVIGSLIYLFNLNRDVFYAVVWWVGYMAISYIGATVPGFSKPHILFNTPLSSLALHIYLTISFVVLRIISHISFLCGLHNDTTKRYRDLSRLLSSRFEEGLLIRKWKQAWKMALKPSSEIDSEILKHILPTLDDDCALEAFVDAIPGFCNSKLTALPFSPKVKRKLQQALNGFLSRTFSSSLVSESVRTGRLITCLDAAHAGLEPDAVSGILDNIFNGHWDEARQSVETGHALRLWCHGRDYEPNIRRIVACIIARVRRRDDRWTMLVTEVFGVPDRVFRDYLADGDSVLLSILIQISRQANQAGSWTPGILPLLSKFDIRHTLPKLQCDFCMLWNDLSQEARNQGSSSLPTKILSEIRHLYIALHQGTDASPTAFSASTEDSDEVLLRPLSYPFCDIANHRHSTPVPHNQALLGGRAAPRLAKETNTIAGPPCQWLSDERTAGKIWERSRPTESAPLVHIGPLPTDAPPQGVVVAALPDTPSTTTLPRPPEGNKCQYIATSHTEPEMNRFSTATTHTPTSTPVFLSVSASPVLDKSWASWDAGLSSTSNALLPAPSIIGFAIPDSCLFLRASAVQIANRIALPNGTTPSYPIDSDTLRLRACGLVNRENKCFSNAVLQLLVHCPPFLNLFREVGMLIVQQGLSGGLEAGGSVTPLVDAKIKFLDEFVYKEEHSVTQQLQPSAARIKTKESGEKKKEHDVVDSFNPKYLYDAMKEKRQLKDLLDGEQQDAGEFLGLYLDALEEELAELHTYIVPSVEKLEKGALSSEGQTEVGKRDDTAGSIESPISRIFGGRSRLTVRVPGQPDIITVEAWRSLQLNIQPDSVHTIQDALAHVSQAQPMQVGQSRSSGVSQQVHIEVLPPVLVLRLKRLLDDTTANDRVKISKSIQFAPELEIPPDPEITAPVAGKSAEPAHYKLYGVLYHHGNSAGSGHYTVDVLHPNGDGGRGEGWLHIDDEAVSVVQHEEVFGSHDNERGEGRCAYMLFYCRTAASTPKDFAS